jgi:signal transduction histidine kinase
MATILVVDDRPANREFLVSLLGYQGHRMLVAIDGREALALVRSERPDLVICDILMPTMDGYEFVRQLRAEREIAATKVIFYTAHFLEREARDLAQAAGVSEILTKPSEPEAVIRKIEEVLGLAQRQAPAVPGAAFDREHLRLLTDKLSQKNDELRATNQRLRALVDLNLQLASQRDPHRLIEEVCRGARALIGARHAALGLRDGDDIAKSHFVVSGMPAVDAMRFEHPDFDRGVLGEVMRKGNAKRLSRSTTTALKSGLPESFPDFNSFLAAPVASHSETYGWICLTDKLGAGEFSDEDEQLLVTLAALAGRGYENGTFYGKVQLRAAEQLQGLLRRLVEVQESERRELSRELHDRVGQNLTALGINLDILRSEVPNGKRADLRSRLEDSIALVEATADAIENVMSELRPPMLDDHGLLPALQWYAKEFSRRIGIEVAVRGEERKTRAGQEVEITLFRIVQEALNNVAKHAKATRVSIDFDQGGDECILTVSDNGIGFDPLESGRRPGRGLVTMRERVEAVGGRFEVISTPREGTEIMVSVPS